MTVTRFGYSETTGLWVSGFVHGAARAADGTETDVEQLFSQVHATLDETGTAAATARTTALAAAATCPILDLDIGAIHLDLLGLVLDLAPVKLDLTAVADAGNLLGNLLCGLVGLLDPLGFLDQLAGTLQGLLDIINSINDILGGIGL